MRILMTALILTISGAAPVIGQQVQGVVANSVLHEPLEVWIPLQLSNAEAAVALDMVVPVEPGIDLLRYREDLTISVINGGDGLSLQVTTEKAVREPLLILPVVLSGSFGTVHREYTIVLDPSDYVERLAAAARRPEPVIVPTALRPTAASTSRPPLAEQTTTLEPSVGPRVSRRHQPTGEVDEGLTKSMAMSDASVTRRSLPIDRASQSMGMAESGKKSSQGMSDTGKVVHSEGVKRSQGMSDSSPRGTGMADSFSRPTNAQLDENGHALSQGM